ncbi:LuxR C-terminal-related transcriptional regulator [Streptomyces sp. NPDC040750]|uniref:LuxR C-terminal-related transcriptional regulator n=1 Tax=Streptomyces sp. NPDC040750 TaxID=3154491 RepID=UPI0033EBD332
MQGFRPIFGHQGEGEFDSDTLRVYQHVLTHDGAPLADVLQVPGVEEQSATTALDRLRSFGLLRTTGKNPETITAVSPATAESDALDLLRQSLGRTMQELSLTCAQLDELRAIGRALPGSSGDGCCGVTVLTDPAVINRRLDEASSACQFEVLTAQPGGPRPVAVLEQAFPRDSAMLARGVRMRTIYQHSARFSESTQAHAERLTEAGAEIRTLDELFQRLLIFDRRTAFIPGGPDSDGAILIDLPSIVAFLVGGFEIAWRSALPLTSAYATRAEGTVISDIQRSVAALLLTEDKDATIARRLGISERTCRSHVSKIMQRLGARNRTHLGYLLALEKGGSARSSGPR